MCNGKAAWRAVDGMDASISIAVFGTENILSRACTSW
jgi:hypothetical protein